MIDLGEAADLVIARARRHAGVEAEVAVAESDRLEAAVRLGRTEKLKRSRERRLALRLFLGQSSATVSTADLAPSSLTSLVDDALALARATAPDPFGGLPDLGDEPALPTDLDLFDPAAEWMSAEDAIAIAGSGERAALDADSRITNSEGAEFSVAARRLLYLCSTGFRGEQRGSSFSLTVVPVAESGGSMQRDAWYTCARHRSLLEAPAAVGLEAARRTVRRLGARNVPTRRVPVVFDPETAAAVLGSVAAAVSGSAVYRGLSFLRDRLGQHVASDAVCITDDPLRPHGLGSRPFDAEGLTSRTNPIVERGTLQTFLLDTYAARRLGLRSTASAVRSLGEPPSAGPSNFFLAPGRDRPAEIIGSVSSGLYVTELIGSGVNPVTGDYSRGAAGMWIDGGELAFPVEGITIAGNLLEMLSTIEAVGSDLAFRSGVSAPTVKIARMTVAGDG